MQKNQDTRKKPTFQLIVHEATLNVIDPIFSPQLNYYVKIPVISKVFLSISKL